MKNKNINTLILSSFFHSILLVGVYTLEDYGVNVEEPNLFRFLLVKFTYLNILI